MKVKAAVLNDVKTPFEITELDLDGHPGPGRCSSATPRPACATPTCT